MGFSWGRVRAALSRCMVLGKVEASGRGRGGRPVGSTGFRKVQAAAASDRKQLKFVFENRGTFAPVFNIVNHAGETRVTLNTVSDVALEHRAPAGAGGGSGAAADHPDAHRVTVDEGEGEGEELGLGHDAADRHSGAGICDH